MAHFAEIDDNNIVLRVVVVDNKDTSNAAGVEKEYIGAAYLESLLGGTWVQTSYNATIRKNYAGIGYTFDKTRDAFIPPKQYPSWVLNEETCQWQAPIPYPNDGNKYAWDESTQSWILSSGGI
jgi:hypothetical protein